MTNRKSIDVIESWIIIAGLLSKGIEVHGPFVSIKEAEDYGGKRLSGATREVIKMHREVITHGEE